MPKAQAPNEFYHPPKTMEALTALHRNVHRVKKEDVRRRCKKLGFTSLLRFDEGCERLKPSLLATNINPSTREANLPPPPPQSVSSGAVASDEQPSPSKNTTDPPSQGTIPGNTTAFAHLSANEQLSATEDTIFRDDASYQAPAAGPSTREANLPPPPPQSVSSGAVASDEQPSPSKNTTDPPSQGTIPGNTTAFAHSSANEQLSATEDTILRDDASSQAPVAGGASARNLQRASLRENWVEPDTSRPLYEPGSEEPITQVLSIDGGGGGITTLTRGRRSRSKRKVQSATVQQDETPVLIDRETRNATLADASSHKELAEAGRATALAVLRQANESRCMACIAKGGPIRSKTKFQDLFPANEQLRQDVASEQVLQCRCRLNGALLAFALYKITAERKLPSGCVLPKWNQTETFTRPGELAYAEIFMQEISGLSIDELLQPRASRLLATANWAIKSLEEELSTADERQNLGDVRLELERFKLPE